MGKGHYYILCPAYSCTGGPELTHQLCYELKKIGIETDMYYAKDGGFEPIDKEPFERYLKYQTTHATSFQEVNQDSSVVVVNETATSYLPLFDNAKRVLWWMSVDNYLGDPYRISLRDIDERVAYHLVQSQYAYDYLLSAGGVKEDKIIWLSDYTQESFFDRPFPDEYRQNMVLFNPKKGYQEIKPLIEMTPEVKWVPLVNMDERLLQRTMQVSKLYIDFGNHPGKDRMPRETAAAGCCVITNKKGSAAFQEDVPIPEKYKFERFQDEYTEIKRLILDICQNYSEYAKDFDEYREWIRGERERFAKDAAHMADVVSRNFL